MILRSVCEMRKVEGKGTWLTFLDVSKPYDTVWRQGYGVKRKLIEVCKAQKSCAGKCFIGRGTVEVV